MAIFEVSVLKSIPLQNHWGLGRLPVMGGEIHYEFYRRSISFRNPGRVEMVKFAVVDQSFRWLQHKISGFVYKEDLHSLKPT